MVVMVPLPLPFSSALRFFEKSMVDWFVWERLKDGGIGKFRRLRDWYIYKP